MNKTDNKSIYINEEHVIVPNNEKIRTTGSSNESMMSSMLLSLTLQEFHRTNMYNNPRKP